ncbi:MAG TPA: SgcJ/EcaC family oxidoreductase [Ramlibacter sp.]|nr:SgcJ/EcaC family oxidoreductase [Ramlibacter sp.]
MPPSTTHVPAGFGRVGFIGLGDMGGPMADNLLAAGFDLSVFDLRPGPLEAARAKGARAAQSLRELADSCGTIGICVWSDDQLTEAVLGPQGLIHGQAAQLTLVVHSTVRPRTVEEIAEAFAPKGWAVLDAPVSGGRAASLTGTLTLMVGGERAQYERHLPYFQAVGEHLFHVGPLAGLGEVAKLCNNLMGLCNAQALIEALKLGTAYGIEEEMLRDVARVSTGDSWYVRNWSFVDNLLKTHPQRDVMYKDLGEALHAARARGVQLLLTGAAAAAAPQIYEERLQRLQGAPGDTEQDRGAQQALDAVLAEWNAAGGRWDVEGLAAVYTEDAVFFGGRRGHSTGREGVRAYFASYADTIASTRLQLQDHVLTRLAPDVLQAQGYGCFDMVLTDGRKTRSVLRATLTLVLRDKAWKVQQHHFSTTPEAPPIGT